MNRKRLISGVLIGLFVVSFFSVVQLAGAASRKELLETFCINNQIDSGAFQDTNNGTKDEVSEFTTYSNLHILSIIDPELENLLDDDKSLAQEWIQTELNKFIDAGDDGKTLRDAYYAYAGYTATGTALNETILDDLTERILLSQDESSFGFKSNASLEPTLPDTYYAVQYLNDTNEILSISTDNVALFTMSCWDSDKNLFAAVPNGTANLIDTFYGLKTLELLGKLDEIESADQESIKIYIDTFYCDDELYTNHFGGYSITQSDSQSSIFFTYVAVEILNMLEGDFHTDTLTWILNRQSARDYGFQDASNSGLEGPSSAKSSYYAVEIILSLEPAAFDQRGNNVMNEELWNLKTSGWIIAAIILGVLVIIAGLIYGIYRYKNRI